MISRLAARRQCNAAAAICCSCHIKEIKRKISLQTVFTRVRSERFTSGSLISVSMTVARDFPAFTSGPCRVYTSFLPSFLIHRHGGRGEFFTKLHCEDRIRFLKSLVSSDISNTHLLLIITYRPPPLNSSIFEQYATMIVGT